MKRTTAITPGQLDELTDVVRAADPSGRWRLRMLDLRAQVQVTVAYLRTNATQAFLADTYGVSQPTISRIVSYLTPVLGWSLEWLVPDPQQASKGTTLLIDGTLTPCWSWKSTPELYSGKHHTTGHNLQIAADPTGRLIYISPALPGHTHDAQAYRLHDLAGAVDSFATGNAIADRGYQGLGLISPEKKPQGGELTDDRIANNKIINRMRAPIERAIANIKTWRVLHTDYRRPLTTFTDTLDAIRGLIFFQLSTPL